MWRECGTPCMPDGRRNCAACAAAGWTVWSSFRRSWRRACFPGGKRAGEGSSNELPSPAQSVEKRVKYVQTLRLRCALRVRGEIDQAVDEAVHTRREDLAAHHSGPVEHQIGLYAGLSGGVVGDLIGIAPDPPAGIPLQIKALGGLERQIAAVALIHLLRDADLLHSQRLLCDLPAAAVEIGDPVRVGSDPLGAGNIGGGRRRPAAGGDQVQHQGGAAQQRGGGRAEGQLPPGQLGSDDQHRAFLLPILAVPSLCGLGQGYTWGKQAAGKEKSAEKSAAQKSVELARSFWYNKKMCEKAG